MNCRPAPLAQRPKKPPIIELEQVWFRYEKELPDVVKGLTLSVPAGEFCALVGGNGTGKTTTLSLISGIRTPNRGAVKLDGRPLADIPDGEKFSGLLGVLPQNPQALFVKKTLELDLYEMLSDRKITKAEKAKKVGAVAALAKVLLLEPRVLLLDEPTKGMDSNFKEKFAQILQSLQAEGATIVMVSHDIEFCARYADRCALFFDGSIVTSGEPRSFFSGNSFYTTAANRMARHLLPGAVTAEDVIAACGGSAAVREGLPATETASAAPQKKPAIPEKPAASWKKPAAALLLSLAAVMILLLIPLTIFIGFYYLDNRKYYFISMLVILETLVPFFMVFERRKPQTRELVVLVVLCAIGVAGLAAFFALPQFKPVAALVILTAVAFGGESGFVVGTLTMFLSNLFYSQGPWTLWQMFAMGIVGFLAGVLFKKGVLRRSRVELCVFGFLATFFVYGAIMNASMVFTYQEKPTLAMLATYCLLGIPFDLIHATATAFFLWVEGPAMLEKLDRIKRKYGLIGS